nr:uncharacterized protein LOC109414016 [Aedes albopictus]
MKNLLPKDKLSTDFHKEKFLVVDKEGTNVTIESDENDKRYERNTSHLRKITEPLNMTPLREYSGDHQMEALTSPPHSSQVQHPFHHASPLIATEQIEPEIVISGDYQDAAPVRRSSRVPKPKCRYSP